MKLDDYQEKAILQMHDGCILCGGVGSGKSLTALEYYKRFHNKKKLYIITTAKKRDSYEWEVELAKCGISKDIYEIDSWNNIKKYTEIEHGFFIFDEQRVVGYGAWTKSFIAISKSNRWILLSATPGDKWPDYMPVFIANGYYKNKSDFNFQHVVYKRYSKFPQIDRYLNEQRLIRLRNTTVVYMDYMNNFIERIKKDIQVEYDHLAWKQLFETRFDIGEGRPIKNASELCYKLRKIVNSDPSRAQAVLDIFKEHRRIIIFYNYDFELDILRSLDYEFEGEKATIAEWNSHKHQPIPDSKYWVYLVQYTSGSEGWNCIKTNTIIFYSLNYSYKQTVQAAGRIDRRNTPYPDLYYYYLKSAAPIDIAIARALKSKKKFNESRFLAS